MPGRPSKPTQIHAIQGTSRKSRIAKRKGELSMDPSIPDPPDFLPPEGLVEWGRITSLSKYAKALAQTDRATIGVYCSLYGEWARSFQPGAEPMQTSRLQLFMNIAGKLGMNPSDRVKVRVPEETVKTNAFAKLGS